MNIALKIILGILGVSRVVLLCRVMKEKKNWEEEQKEFNDILAEELKKTFY